LVSNLSKDGRSQLEKLANNPPANAADCEKAVHGGGYASGSPFRQAFPASGPPNQPRSCRNIARESPEAGEFQPG
jgi:hypothetical protein